MTNFEKHAEKIKEMITAERNDIDCVVSELRGIGLRKCDGEECAECAFENIGWLMQEYSKNCTDCKWYRKIEGENKYYACLKKVQLIARVNKNRGCDFWEGNKL